MKKQIVCFGFLALILSAQGFAKESLDYSRCVARHGIGDKYNPIPFSLGPDGHLAIPDDDETYKRSENTETATEFLTVGNVNRSVKLTKINGKPVSLESSVPGGGIVSGDKVAYSWDGNNCFVSQMIVNTNAEGGEAVKKSVVYDKKFCDEVLDAVKGMQAKKLQECSDTFNRITNIAKKYKDSFKTRGLELASSVASRAFNADSANNGFDFAASCKAYREQFPTNGIIEKRTSPPYLPSTDSSSDTSETKNAE